MREYKNIISLSKNKRGIWDLDTIKGCSSGLIENENGCYGDCYAFKTAKRYGIDFSKSICRDFIDINHKNLIVSKIQKIDMPFIRIGCSGDPSENWEHTIKIIKQLQVNNQLNLFGKETKKHIVIITRNWNILTDEQLIELSKYNVIFNISVSALDSEKLIEKSLIEYNRIKNYCKTYLRVITCNFNLNNETGIKLNNIQQKLLSYNKIIETIFRPSKNNKFVINNIINISKANFLNSKIIVSKNSNNIFLGKCKNCKELCGVNM